jgi:hypothetical protein
MREGTSEDLVPGYCIMIDPAASLVAERSQVLRQSMAVWNCFHVARARLRRRVCERHHRQQQ